MWSIWLTPRPHFPTSCFSGAGRRPRLPADRANQVWTASSHSCESLILMSPHSWCINPCMVILISSLTYDNHSSNIFIPLLRKLDGVHMHAHAFHITHSTQSLLKLPPGFTIYRDGMAWYWGYVLNGTRKSPNLAPPVLSLWLSGLLACTVRNWMSESGSEAMLPCNHVPTSCSTCEPSIDSCFHLIHVPP